MPAGWCAIRACDGAWRQGTRVTERLPARLEVSALLRQVQAAGGFACVIAKGEPDAGTLLAVLCHNGGAQDEGARAYERMPAPDGTRQWQLVRKADPERPEFLPDYLDRRRAQDRDLWIIELDIAGAERFIGLPPPES